MEVYWEGKMINFDHDDCINDEILSASIVDVDKELYAVIAYSHFVQIECLQSKRKNIKALTIDTHSHSELLHKTLLAIASEDQKVLCVYAVTTDSSLLSICIDLKKEIGEETNELSHRLLFKDPYISSAALLLEAK